MHRSNSSRSAFTLVEMAIVIVIIGLLVGGLFATKSYIRNAKLATMMTEAKYYINAMGQFQTQYKALPGDIGNAASMWSGTSDGDANGLIRAHTTTANPIEIYLAFQHLALAGYITGTYSGTAVNVYDGSTWVMNGIPGTNLPTGVLPNVTYFFDHPNDTSGNVSGDSFYFDGMYNHVLRIGAVCTTCGVVGYPSTGFISPTEALELDRKFDDAKPGTGLLTVPKNSFQPDCADSNNAATAVYVTTPVTTAYNGDQTCSLIMKI